MIQALNRSSGLPSESSAADRRLAADGFSERWTFNSHGTAILKACRRTGSHPRRFECSDASLISLITEAHATSRPVVRSLGCQLAGLASPLPDPGPPQIGLQVFDCDSPLTLELIQGLALHNWSLNATTSKLQSDVKDRDEQLEAYAAQVSEDLEEVTWLRNLASNLELSDTGNSVERIAESVLPSLARLIRAETVVFVRDQPMAGINTPLPVVWQTGRVRLHRDQCLALVAEHRELSPDKVIVRNLDAATTSAVPHRVESYIVVPVANNSGRLGWLVAVNKDHAQTLIPAAATAQPLKTHMSEDEFGSFEASLMSATAVILAAHGRNCRLFHEKELLLRGVVRSMINAIDAKDSYTCGHSDRVAEFARQIARQLAIGAAECEEIYMAGLLHDVGKIGVPDHVLKKPGRLTDEEFEHIKKHPVIGYEILKHLDNLSAVLPGVLHHHEAVDGSGYPHGLVGDAIPLSARILAVADSYDAMTSNRPYRRGMPTDRAEQILRDGAGTQWDVTCVDAFFRTIHGIRIAAARVGRSDASRVPELV